jgi:hypothetical protein
MSENLRSRRRVPLSLALFVRGVDIHGERFLEVTRSRNVSGGGVCFESRRDFLIGGRVDLAIDIPFRLRRYFHDKSRYDVRAVICRVEEPQPDGFKRVGARFLKELTP